MASKKEDKYKIGFLELKKNLLKASSVPNNIILFTQEKILLDKITEIISQKFLGKSTSKEYVRTFYGDEKNIEGVINECSNISMFSEKKIVILKVLKRIGAKGGFTNAERQSLLNYIGDFNPDVVLILNVIDKEFNIEHYEDFLNSNVSGFILNSGSEEEITNWVKSELDDYKINDESIIHLLQFLNPSYDEIYSELDKLKTFCIDKKIITKEDINACIGLSKDYDEDNFVEAVLSGDYENAIKIYDKLNLKEEIEIRLVYFLSSAVISVRKLMDPSIESMSTWERNRELKLWGADAEKKYRLLKNFKAKINELKLKMAFDYIYNADKALKSTGLDKKPIITDLIYNLTRF